MSNVIPLFRPREAAADPISIPEPPCGRGAIARRGYRFEAVPGRAATWSIRQQSGRFIGWLRHTRDAVNGGAT